MEVQDSGSYVANHWHNSLEIIYITSGDLQINMEVTLII